jgi:hypothetical protein
VFARELTGQARTQRLQACPEAAPDDYAVLPDPPGSEEDDDEEYDAEASSVGPGWLTSSQNCLFPALEITTGRQVLHIGGRAGGLLGPFRTIVSSQRNATVGFTHVNHG